MIELGDAASPLDIGGHAYIAAASQDVVDKRGEVAPRSNFDEDASTLLVELLNGSAKLDRPNPVVHQQLANRLWVLGIRSGGRRGKDWHPRSSDRHASEDLAQVRRIGREPRRMVGPIQAEVLVDQPLLPDQ